MGKKEPKLGATGQFPRGKIHKTDEGEIVLEVTHREGNVIIDFGTQVVWLGFPPVEARALAAKIIKHADAIEKETPK